MDEAQSRSSGFGGTATLYLMRINVTPKVIQNMKNAKELLKSVGIEGKKVKEVDLTNNLSLREKIQQKVLSEKGDRSLKKGFPIIFLDDVPIGSVDDLAAWIKEHVNSDLRTSGVESTGLDVEKLTISDGPHSNSNNTNVLVKNVNIHQNQPTPRKNSGGSNTNVGTISSSPPRNEVVPPAHKDEDKINLKKLLEYESSKIKGYDSLTGLTEITVDEFSDEEESPRSGAHTPHRRFSFSASPPRQGITIPNSSNVMPSPDLINDYSPENKSFVVPPSSSGSSSDPRLTAEDNKTGANNKELQNNMTLFSKTVNTVETLIAPGAKRLADWWYGSSSKPKHEIKGPVPNEEPTSEAVEYTVLRTNWYWRQQVRILRLEKDSFSRLLPKSNSTRGQFRYSEIEKLTKYTQNNFFTITFKDKTEEYYESPKMDEIVDEIAKRAKQNKHVITVVQISDD
jgi:glutaredoxin